MKRILLIAVLLALTCLTLVPAASAQAVPQAVPVAAKPFVFVGPAGYCPWAPLAGTDMVNAAWVTQVGLPDAGDKIHALFLQKFGPTLDCSWAGATIDGVTGITLSELGYDVRNDLHCSYGAPRFEVVMSIDGLHTVGCLAGTGTGPWTDPYGNTWTRKRWTADDLANLTGTFVYPTPITPTSGTVVSINIIFDEGTDAGPDKKGYTYLDNIDVNTVVIGKQGIAKP